MERSNPLHRTKTYIFDPQNAQALLSEAGYSDPSAFPAVTIIVNSEFDRLVEQAKRNRKPAERQELYILAERLLCETEAAVIALYHATTP